MTVALHFNPPVIAHRGASAYAPENTLAAFTKAIQLDCKWIEFDVMQAACGTPILFHDDDLARTTSGKGQMHTYPYTYLETLDAGAWFDLRFSGERIPSLQQVIHYLEHNKLCVNVEIKSMPDHEEDLVKNTLELLLTQLPSERLLFSSFSNTALHQIRRFAPHCQLGLLMHDWEPNWQEECVRLNCVSVHVNHEILTPHTAKLIKDMHKSLLCYTVNDPLRAKTLFDWGVDAVFSDVPDKIIAIL